MLEDATGRKVVLVFTDGDDTASRKGFGDVLDKARDKEVDGLRHRPASRSSSTAGACSARVRTALRRLADETGGGYFELKKTDELAPTFTRVAQELHSLYTLGLHAGRARRQGAQARGQGEATRQDRAARARATSRQRDRLSGSK